MTSFFSTPRCTNTTMFRNSACFTTTISKLLDILIIVASILVKVPQILKIYRNKSGEGISLLSVTTELVGLTIFLSYSVVMGFPFSEWGDTFFLVIHGTIIGMLILYYNKEPERALCYGVVCWLSLLVLLSGAVSVNILWAFQAVNIFIFISAKMIQILTNYRNGHTGYLSSVTVFIIFLGSLVRIFTTVVETGDMMTIVFNLVATLANAFIGWQIWYYRDVTKEKFS